MENKELTQTAAPLSSFEQAQRQAKALSASDLVPQQYKYTGVQVGAVRLL
jgi:hypothetical protein